MRYRTLLLLCSLFPFTTALRAQTVTDSNLQVTPFATGLFKPTGFAFDGTAADADLYVIEKETGAVKRIRAGVSTTLLTLPVNIASERGLLGIALDPHFATKPFIYLYYSRSSTGAISNHAAEWTGNRLSRFQLNGDTLGHEQPLFNVPERDRQNNGPNHDGGPICFGPDGKLYGVTGDLNRLGAEQNQGQHSSSTGGLYRVNRDGTTPTDNPFRNDGQKQFHKWFAYGIRNSFGLAFDPVTGQLWDTENGADAYDEINRVVPGFNSGWSRLMGPSSRHDLGTAGLIVKRHSFYADPEFSFEQTIAITSIHFLSGSTWGATYDDGVLVGDYNHGQLYLFRLDPDRAHFVPASTDLEDQVADTDAEAAPLVFGTGFTAVTGIERGPGGDVFVLTLAGTLYRIQTAPAP